MNEMNDLIVPAIASNFQFKASIVFVNPSNPDDKMEFESIEALNQRLFDFKAEVERLTKAGDTMLSEWSSGDEKDANNFRKALVIWLAAKEGNGQP